MNIDKELIRLLSRLELFEGIKKEDLFPFVDAFIVKTVAAGDVVFHAGDESSSMCIVQQGRLGIYSQLPLSAANQLATVSVGESVGEMGMIRKDKRSAEVVALRQSKLLFIDEALFERLCHAYPSILLKLSQILSDRIENANKSKKSRKHQAQTFSLCVLNIEEKEKNDFLQAMLLAFDQLSMSVKVVTDRVELAYLSQLEQRYQCIIFCSDEYQLDFFAENINYSDEILLLNNSESLAITAPTQSILSKHSARLPIKHFIIHHDNILVEKNYNFQDIACDIYHIRSAKDADLRRFVRLVTNQAIGVVLAGGGAKGFGHIGAMKALAEMNVEYDVIAGTSMGAIVAGVMAQEQSIDEIITLFEAFFLGKNPIGDWTLPSLSLAKGQRLDNSLKKGFGQRKIEHLWCTFFCIASGLNSAKTNVLDKGLLWKAIRASISLPGILPPIEIDGELMVDGGMLNNLPVDIMKMRGIKKVIAIDLQESDYWGAEFTQLNLQPTFLQRIRNLFMRRESPTLLNILMRSAILGGSSFAMQRLSEADYPIKLPLDHYGLLEWKSLHDIIDIGYQHVKEQLGEEYFKDVIVK